MPDYNGIWRYSKLKALPLPLVQQQFAQIAEKSLVNYYRIQIVSRVLVQVQLASSPPLSLSLSVFLVFAQVNEAGQMKLLSIRPAVPGSGPGSGSGLMQYCFLLTF